MKKLPKNRIYKFLVGIVLVGGIVILCFGMSGSPAAHAQAADTPTPTPNIVHFASSQVTLKDGQQVEKIIINGPSKPPAGYNRPTVSLNGSVLPMGVTTLNVPAYEWSFGCSATSASMIAAYYDQIGYSNIYTGPTNGGVMPMDSSVWPSWTDGNGDSYAQCPLTASHNGLDGRVTRGSIDDYWVSYGSSAQDPFITNSWTQHSYGDAIGDYMRTSQSNYGNSDGSTSFWDGNGTPLTCSVLAANKDADGTLGRELFYQAKGYSVTNCYNETTDNNGGGFTFAMYKAEIDAGRPVLLNIWNSTEGHSIVGFGYDSSTNTVYLHDTWDYSTHTMTWGGSYAGMTLGAVSIVDLATLSKYPLNVSLNGTGAGSVSSNPNGINCGSTCSYSFNYNTPVTLTATATSPSTFGGWGGDCSGTGTCTVTMNTAHSVTATFNSAVQLQPVSVTDVFTTDENGPSAVSGNNPQAVAGNSLTVKPFTNKTTFNPGDPIQLHIEADNQNSTDETATFQWIVLDPAGQDVPALEWSGGEDIGAGYWDWWLPRSIPAGSPPGNYTFTGKITFNGVTTSASTDFFVNGSYQAFLPMIFQNFTVSPGIVNGDFESGSTGWTEYSLLGYAIIVSSTDTTLPVTPHSGTYLAWLGGADNEIAYVQQQVTISSGAPYLVYWQWIASDDACGFDFGGVLINNSVVDDYDLCTTFNTGGWVTHSVDLSAYAGQSVMLQIRVETDGSVNSNLFIDDVSLQAAAAASGLNKPIVPNLDASSAQGKSGIIVQKTTPQGAIEERLFPINEK